MWRLYLAIVRALCVAADVGAQLHRDLDGLVSEHIAQREIDLWGSFDLRITDDAFNRECALPLGKE